MMPKQTETKERILLIFFWTLSGATILAALVFLAKTLGSESIKTGELLISSTLGGVGGFLIGRNNLRWHAIINRLEDNDRRFHSLYQHTPAMLQTMDRDGRLVSVSQSWLDCLGYTRKDVIGHNFFDFVVAENSSELKQQHLEFLHKHASVRNAHYTLRHAEGHEI